MRLVGVPVQRFSAVALILLVLLGFLPTFAPQAVYAAPCQVVLRITTISIIDDADPGFLDRGEMYIESALSSAATGAMFRRTPAVGTVSKGSGEVWVVDSNVVETGADSSQFPIAFAILIRLYDEDPGPDDLVGQVNDVLNTPCPSDQSFIRPSSPNGESIIRYQVIVTGPPTPTTDWAVLSVGLNPSAPKAGDPVIFRMTMTVFSTSGGYPQSVPVQCQVDGITCGGGTLPFPGPTGNPLTVDASTPWPASAGPHTLTWSISASNDPNPGNNVMSTSFTVQPAEAPFDFSVSASPTSQTAIPGGTATYAVTVNLVSGSAQSVTLTLSGTPGGVTGAFSPDSGNPTFTSTLSLSLASSVSPGNYPMTVTGTGGGKTHTTAITLTVSQSPDFQIQANPLSQIVGQGQTALYSINVVGLNQFNSQVSLSGSGLPSGVIVVFSTPFGTPSFTSTLTVALPANAPAGLYTLTITGTGGGLTRTANVVLQITAVQTQTQTQTEPGQTPSAGLVEMLQQNSLLVIGILGLIVLLLAMLAFRRRAPTQPSLSAQPVRSGIFCGNCGTQNPTGNEFCGKCGQRLQRPT